MTASERFAGLPTGVQNQLLRLSRSAAGMSEEEKFSAQILLDSVAMECSKDYELQPVGEMLSACSRIVAVIDQASGSAASILARE